MYRVILHVDYVDGVLSLYRPYRGDLQPLLEYVALNHGAWHRMICQPKLSHFQPSVTGKFPRQKDPFRDVYSLHQDYIPDCSNVCSEMLCIDCPVSYPRTYRRGLHALFDTFGEVPHTQHL